VALFPHGKIHLDSEPPRPLKPGAAMLAQATGASLAPVRISGVRGAGQVLPALFIRSRVEIRTYARIEPAGQDTAQLLERLSLILNGAAGQPRLESD
jgi:1-acyl-sn-glycerol-3-phosphate acyltransferase